MPAPKIFISYSHDSQEHKDWVLRLATDLRTGGIVAVLDRWDLSPGQDMAAFMAGGIRTADRVILVCTDQYVAKAEAGTGGVGYERLIVTAGVVGSIDTIKFIPIVRDNTRGRKVPDFLGPRLYIDFSDDAQYSAKLEELMREIHQAPAVVKPPLGPNPFKGEVINPEEPVRVAGPSGATAAGVPILNGEWFEDQHSAATAGFVKLNREFKEGSKLTGAMEVRFGLHNGLNKSQLELLNAVRSSQIETFGWPIAALLENTPECIGRVRSVMAFRRSLHFSKSADGRIQALFERDAAAVQQLSRELLLHGQVGTTRKTRAKNDDNLLASGETFVWRSC